MPFSAGILWKGLNFMPSTSPVAALTGSYDYYLVAVSILIAMLASYAALDLAGRVTVSWGLTRVSWLTGGAAAMGLGIWSMHYIGMLAYRLPVVVLYDWPTVLVSLLAAVLASGVALHVVSRDEMKAIRTGIASLLMGGGIAAMHYIGMEAMRLPAMCRYSTRTRDLVGHLGRRHFVSCVMADVPAARGDRHRQLEKTGQRNPDGNGNSHHALHRHGRRNICADEYDPGTCPLCGNFRARNRRNNNRNAYGSRHHDPNVIDRSAIFHPVAGTELK